MIISELKLWNFRKYGHNGETPGLIVKFHKGINLLVGENNSGKTTIIDAVKIVLQTQSNEFIRISEDDFHVIDEKKSETDLRIECIFEEFTTNEAKNFIEWLEYYKETVKEAGEEKTVLKYRLSVWCHAWVENGKIYTDVRAGVGEEGKNIDAKARELLKSIYLRPLRDAEKEMRAGKNSRLSQILKSHPVFSTSDNHKLVQILKEANESIEKYFTEDSGVDVRSKIITYLEEFSTPSTPINAQFITSEMRLKSILESLSLSLSQTKPGLGTLNLLFIAAELLLLNQDDNGGLKLALIEEIEAHLHPQAQLRLIEYIQKAYDNSGVQFILSTHSANISSKINIKNILLCRENSVFSLAPEKTELEKGDYLFLQRFLDVTKANMFFAQGILMVEGDAEQLLLPTIAEIIDYPLSKNGVSLINVGSLAFLRYSKIFLQKDGTCMGIPVAIVTDSDVKPELIEGNQIKENTVEVAKIKKRKEELYNKSAIKAFIAPHWTFEYVLALSELKKDFYKAVHYAKKIQNSDKYALTVEKIKEVNKTVEDDFKEWIKNKYSDERIAFEIYNNHVLKEGNKVSKAIIAQCFASILNYKILEKTESEGIPEETMFDIDMHRANIDKRAKEELKILILRDEKLKYLVGAITYAATAEVK